MSGWGQDITALYFEYKPVAGHLDGCPHYGTDLWEATRFRWESYSGDRSEVRLRLACHECGVVHYESASTRPDPQDCGQSSQTTHASEVGYASKPERVAGLWLWPGPRIWHGDDRGPVSYLITAANKRPRRPEDVLGRVAWSLGSRGGVRWSAGTGCSEHGNVLQAAGQTWTSRRAAVAWVAEHAGGLR